LVEIDDKKDEDGEEANPRKLSRDERKKNIKLNERQEKKNSQREGRNMPVGLGPKKGSGVGKRR
jgi:hypothetical protein